MLNERIRNGKELRRQATTRRTLHYYWQVTHNHLGLYVTMVLSTIGFGVLLSYGNPFVMSLIVDRISAEPVAADQMSAVFGPYILALLLINVFGQGFSRLQEYTLWKLEIAVSYDLATMCFDCLCNQSISFHSNRFGGTLVSQTSKFMAAYNQLVEGINFPFLPVLESVVFICIILGPRVPMYVVVLMVLLFAYGAVSYLMYRRILNLNEKAAGAQNQLSGELADSVANILAVKTYGRENIAYGRPDATMDEIREAARQANALEFIEALPQGFDTVTGERGVKLSGGQRQRVAIARAMLADCPILVLDEATSALDSESERLVQEALARLMAGRTSIVVAHRLSTVASLNRIVVLSDGRIAEDGPHADLVAKDGDYALLWNRQTGAYLE